MKLIFALFAILLAIVGGIAYLQTNQTNISLPFGNTTPTATINEQKFNITVAKTPQEKETGLSGKDSLPENSGMLFPFDRPDYYAFWMKDMKFSIDILYINGNKIVTIVENAQPPKSKDEILPIYKPDELADTILEINAGLSKKYNIKKGDLVKIENL